MNNPITEDDIAHYLSNTPDFFVRHAELLAAVQFTSPHGNRAVEPAGAPGRDAAREDQGAGAAHHGNDPQRQRKRHAVRTRSCAGRAAC